MLLAIQNAEKGQVDNLTILVDIAEKNVHAFDQVIRQIAKPEKSIQKSPATNKSVENRRKHEDRVSDIEMQTQLQHQQLCFGQHSISYDLPSMRTYCVQVAPSYASYLKASQPQKKSEVK